MASSAYPLVKQLLRDRLAARGGLAGVVVSYNLPENREDLVGSGGRYEGLYFDSAEGEAGVQVFTGTTGHHWSEEYEQTVIVQVMDGASTGTQRTVDARAGEIVAEVLEELGDNTFRVALEAFMSEFDHIYVTPARQRWVTGYLSGTSGGHGATCELGLQVEARRAY